MAKKQFVVIGMGRFGQSVARGLASLGREVLAVDNDEALVAEIAPHVTHAVQADATDEKTMIALGIRNFDVAVVAIGIDIQASILVTMLCKELGVGFVLAKAVSELHGKVLYKTGADRVVFPERDMGLRVAHNLANSNILDYIEIAGDLRIVDISALPEWENKSLLELDLRVAGFLKQRAVLFVVHPVPAHSRREGALRQPHQTGRAPDAGDGDRLQDGVERKRAGYQQQGQRHACGQRPPGQRADERRREPHWQGQQTRRDRQTALRHDEQRDGQAAQ